MLAEQGLRSLAARFASQNMQDTIRQRGLASWSVMISHFFSTDALNRWLKVRMRTVMACQKRSDRLRSNEDVGR